MRGIAHPSDPAVQARFGEFTFDFGSRLLLRNGVALHLSPKAQLLLRLLLLARPRALSREDLYDALWPSTFVCETNLTSIVNEVRRALGDSARKPHHIRTVHGFGYAFAGALPATAPRSTAIATLCCEGIFYTLLVGENVVGRAADAQVVLPYSSISRRHAMLRVHDDGMSIADLGSTNGTYVNGQRIGSSAVTLTKHSLIEFGVVKASMVSGISSTAKLQLDQRQLRMEVAQRMAEA